MSFCRDWPNSLYDASFKGVGFEVDNDTRAGGRRIVVHEYPNREFWDVEELGRSAAIVQVTGFVHGDNADQQSQALIAQCDSPGPGLLVLPVRSPAMAYAQRCYSTFVKDELGRIPFEMEFVLQSPGIGGIFSTILLSGLVASSVVTALGAVSALFDANFNSIMRRFSPAAFVPAVARDASALAIVNSSREITRVRRAVAMSDGIAESEVEYITRSMADNSTSFAYQGQRPNRADTKAFVRDQIEVASGFGAAVISSIGKISDGATDPAAAADELASLASFAAPKVFSNINTLSVRAEKALGEEVAAIVRRTALLYRAKSLTGFHYRSRVKAVTARADIASAFETEMATIGDPATEIAMQAARNAAMNYITKTSVDRPPVVTVDSAMSLPAAVIATTLYNDASRDAELVARNEAPHALYMPLTIEAARPV